MHILGYVKRHLPDWMRMCFGYIIYEGGYDSKGY